MARILFDARLVLDRPTGIGQYVAALLPELIRLAPGHEVHVLRRPDPWPGYRLQDLPAAHHESHVRHMSLLQHVAVPALAARIRADLLHYPHFDAPCGLGVPRLVATIHDVKYLAHPEFLPGQTPWKLAYMRWMFSRTLRRGTVITHSYASAADLARLFPRAASGVRVVPAAADPRFVRAGKEEVHEFRSKHGLTRPFLLAVGEFRPHKNHERLVRAWARCRYAASHDLVLVGQPHPGGPHPARERAAVGGAGQLRVLQDLSHEDLAAAYSAAELFAMVSLYEGFGLPILEAMACGAPVIAASTTATGEVAGDAALLVDPTNEEKIAGAIDRVLSSPDEAERLRRAGTRRASAYSWQQTAEGVLEAYGAVLEG